MSGVPLRTRGWVDSCIRWGRGARVLALVLGVGSALLGAAGWPARASADETAAWGPVEVAGHRVAPGETARFFVDLAQTFGGERRMLDAFVVVTRGERPGPTLCLTAGVHGDELDGLEIAHRIYAETDGAT